MTWAQHGAARLAFQQSSTQPFVFFAHTWEFVDGNPDSDPYPDTTRLGLPVRTAAPQPDPQSTIPTDRQSVPDSLCLGDLSGCLHPPRSATRGVRDEPLEISVPDVVSPRQASRHPPQQEQALLEDSDPPVAISRIQKVGLRGWCCVFKDT